MDQQVPDEVESTGVTAVDEVLQRVSQLADRPVSEHVEAFERAHEQLRRALDARADAGPSNDQGA